MDHEVVIVGAGFSGIGTGIKLDQAGFGDFVILEQGDGVGGAWHHNTYPGVAVDTPSFSYSFSFEQNPRWSRVYAPGHELKAYAEHCVDKYALRDRIRLNTEVVSMEWDDEAHLWRLTLGSGETVTARYVVGAAGALTKPVYPDIPGLESFKGKVMHSARWEHDHSLSGERVAVIGTGASALQVIPSIAAEVEHLTVFQRTPIWVLPKTDLELGPMVQAMLRLNPVARHGVRLMSHALLEAVLVLGFHYYTLTPGLTGQLQETGLRHLRKQVRDPELRAKLTPRYDFGCKRPSFSNTYFPTFLRDNVTLETNPIVEITPRGVRTASAEHEVDMLILATGFKTFEKGNTPPYPVRGVDDEDLESWFDENRYQAYQGVSVPGFPNSFTILGPYGFNGTSFFHLIEAQSRHIVRLLQHARRNGATKVDVTPEANAAYFQKMLDRRKRQLFFNSDCAGANSYYFDSHGDVPFRPATTLETHWRSRFFDLGDYRFQATA